MEIESAGAIVSGGASGLGEATVRRLHADGAHVVIADLNREKGEALVADLGDRASFHETNVTDADSVEAAVTAASQAPRGLRIAVGCAGIGWAQRVTGKGGPHPLDLFKNVVEVNLVGMFNLMRLATTADERQRSRRRAASAACSSAPPRSPPSTARSARSPTRPPRAASSA